MGPLFAPPTMRRASFLCMLQDYGAWKAAISDPMRWLLASLILTLASPASAASYMVGTWFGHGQPDDKEAMYIDRMRADGSWRGEYRTCIKGKAARRGAGRPLDASGRHAFASGGHGERHARAAHRPLQDAGPHRDDPEISQPGLNFPYTPAARAGRFQDAVLPVEAHNGMTEAAAAALSFAFAWLVSRYGLPS